MTSANQVVSVTLAAEEKETVVASSINIAAGSTLSNLTFSGEGTLTLKGRFNNRLNLNQDNSSFTGIFVADTGLVSASNNNALGNATLLLTNGGGLMNADSTPTWSQEIQIRGSGSIKSGWSKISTVTGTISDENSNTPGSLTILKDGGWIHIDNGNNTYSGGTTIAGNVLLNSNGTPLGTGNVTMSGGALNLNGKTITTGGLTGTDGTISGTGIWTWNLSDGKTYVYQGVLPSLSWGVQGVGTQEFAGTGTLDAQVVQVGGTQGGNLVLSGEKVLNLNGNWQVKIGGTAGTFGAVLGKDSVQIVSSGNATLRAFWIGENGAGTLTLQDQASLTLQEIDHFAVAKTSGTGTLNLHDQAKITVTGNWFVLADSGGNATMNMTGGEVDINASFHMGAGTSELNFSGGTIDVSSEFLLKAGGTIHFHATTAGFGKIHASSMGRADRTDLLAGKIDFGIAAGATVISAAGLETFENAFVTGTRNPAANTFSVSSNLFDIQDSGTAWSLAFSDSKAKRSEVLTIAGSGEKKGMFSFKPLAEEGENWSEYGWLQLDLRQLKDGEGYQLDLQLVGEGNFQALEAFMNEMMAYDTSDIQAEVDAELSLLSIIGLTRNLGEDFAWFAYDLTSFNAQYDSSLGIVGLMAYQVPEPRSCLLMLLGLSAIFYLRKRGQEAILSELLRKNDGSLENKNIAKGFTLVELLVVIAIIGMLVGLLLPAVQQAREAARQMQCNNNLRQMGLAVLNLESSIRHFPSGGWCPGIMGDPDKGFGREQPGTWAYSLLPFLEQQALWGMGQGENDSSKKNKITERAKVPIATFYCPSRRPVAGYPYKGSLASNANIVQNDAVAKNDYAANAADDYAETVTYSASELTSKNPNVFYKHGVIYGASIVTLGEIRDGTTNTYLLAEKYLDPNCYVTGTGEGDDLSAWNGADNDRLRRTGWKEASDSLTKVDCRPLQDRASANYSIQFGSCHSGAFGAVMCDGSVQRISYSIEPEVHSYLGRKADGKIASIPQ